MIEKIEMQKSWYKEWGELRNLETIIVPVLSQIYQFHVL